MRKGCLLYTVKKLPSHGRTTLHVMHMLCNRSIHMHVCRSLCHTCSSACAECASGRCSQRREIQVLQTNTHHCQASCNNLIDWLLCRHCARHRRQLVMQPRACRPYVSCGANMRYSTPHAHIMWPHLNRGCTYRNVGRGKSRRCTPNSATLKKCITSRLGLGLRPESRLTGPLAHDPP